MKLEAHLEERTSKKSGNVYKCIVVKLTDKIEKIIFLDDTEVELLNLVYSKKGE